MGIVFEQAHREKAKARILLAGPSGSGKTYSALQLAKGLGGSVVVLDTEQGSAHLYAHLFKYTVGKIQPPYTVDKYMEALRAAEKQFDIVILDTLSALWSGEGGLLDQQQKIVDASSSKNTYTAWKTITPKWSGFLEAMLASPAHIICTSRSKQDYQQVEENGKRKVVKLGMAPQLRDSTEYEFTVSLDISHEKHLAVASKDRTTLFPTDAPFLIGEATGRMLLDWLNEGVDVTKSNTNYVETPPASPADTPTPPSPAPQAPIDDSGADSLANNEPIAPSQPPAQTPKESKINWGKLHVAMKETGKAIGKEITEDMVRDFGKKYFSRDSRKDWTLDEFDTAMKWLRSMWQTKVWVD